MWYHWASQVVLVVKNLPANAGDVRNIGLIPGSGRSPGEGNGNHSSILAWRIPWTEEPGPPIGSQRIGHDWSDLAHSTSEYPQSCFSWNFPHLLSKWIGGNRRWNAKHFKRRISTEKLTEENCNINYMSLQASYGLQPQNDLDPI